MGHTRKLLLYSTFLISLTWIWIMFVSHACWERDDGGKLQNAPQNIAVTKKSNDIRLGNEMDKVELISPMITVRKLVYNRVPKTASGSINFVLDALKVMNKFTWQSSRVFKEHAMSPDSIARLSRMIDKYTSLYVYDKHMYHVNFTRYNVTDPAVYINVIRDPIARLVSWYYFIRFSHPRNMTREKREQSYDECVARRSPECVNHENYYQLIPFFCGQDEFCRIPGTRSLQHAKRMVVEEYSVVGLTDQLVAFFHLLEYRLPQFFSGAVNVFKKTEDYMHKQTRSKKTSSINCTTRAYMEDLLSYDYHFYYFCRQRFYSQLLLLNS